MRNKTLFAAAIALVTTAALATAGTPSAKAAVPFPIENLDGSSNNVAHPDWGQSGRPYLRVAAARYADGRSQPVGGPNTRYLSNREFNDINQNVFSEHRVTQWTWTWGQILDHTFGLRDENGEAANIPFNSADPLENFTNTLGVIPFTRSKAAPGTGVSNPREQINTTSTYLNAFAVYGGTNARLDWLRSGTVDGNPTNNSASLLLPGNYLPRRDARGNPASAPPMALDGQLLNNPNSAVVAGDVRGNENMALTAVHTLLAREHNRIVALLPNTLSQEDRFQIARRVIMAEQQYITYNEFLPAMGVNLPAYAGYNANVNATLSNEFATVGYRVHSMIHGEFEFVTNVSRYSAADLAFFRAQGVAVEVDGADVELAIPTNVAFFNPELLKRLQIGPFLTSLGESQYKDDEQIDNSLRSVLFQVPVPGNPNCTSGGPDPLPECFRGVVDLGAIDVERGRDHGMPSYNQLRQAYGLAAKTSFTGITGEATDAFPAGSGVDNRNSLDFLSAADIDHTAVPVGQPDGTVFANRRSTIAARLKAVYGGNVNNVDAFAGMLAEPHLPGAEFGELQLAIWRKQFQALRDGDRFFYGNDQGLSTILSTYGIDYRTTLGDLISRNTDIPRADLNDNVFLVEDDDLPATKCSVSYVFSVPHWDHGSQIALQITNTGTTTINSWNLKFSFASGQTVRVGTGQSWNGNFSQNGVDVTVTNASWNGTLAPGQSTPAGPNGPGFNGTWDNATDPLPVNFTVNGNRCSRG